MHLLFQRPSSAANDMPVNLPAPDFFAHGPSTIIVHGLGCKAFTKKGWIETGIKLHQKRPIINIDGKPTIER
jgi:hypothetical protein